MALVTLESLRTQARQRADQEFSSFISDSEANQMINASARELYDLLTSVYDDYYFTTLNFTVGPSSNTFALPADFYKLRGVDEVVTSQQNVTVLPYEWTERNLYISLINQRNLRLYYIPQMPELVNDTDTFDGINGFEQYIVADVARKMLIKEESDPSAMMAEKAELKQRILGMGQNRNAGDANRIPDVNRRDAWIIYSYPQRLRYRLQGNSLAFVQTNFFSNIYD